MSNEDCCQICGHSKTCDGRPLCLCDPAVPSPPAEEQSNEVFRNMAGRPDIDDALIAELRAAGIGPVSMNLFKQDHEVSTTVRGYLTCWSFQRAWYYWIAKGSGIPLEYAIPLHERYGKAVRVEGHCDCPHPLEYLGGFAVGMYHVDTPQGLKALADTLRQIRREAKERILGAQA